MLLIEQMAPTESTPTERLVLPFDLRCKSRLRTRLESGEECGLFLERGQVLRMGDKLLANDGRIVEVVASVEGLYEASSANQFTLMRAAYHLGNRHVALEIRPGKLRFARDSVLAEMVRGLGLEVYELNGPFEPEGGAYGGHGSHGNHGAHDHAPGALSLQSRARIHDHFKAA